MTDDYYIDGEQDEFDMNKEIKNIHDNSQIRYYERMIEDFKELIKIVKSRIKKREARRED